jgi:hypothetical protein
MRRHTISSAELGAGSAIRLKKPAMIACGDPDGLLAFAPNAAPRSPSEWLGRGGGRRRSGFRAAVPRAEVPAQGGRSADDQIAVDDLPDTCALKFTLDARGERVDGKPRHHLLRLRDGRQVDASEAGQRDVVKAYN